MRVQCYSFPRSKGKCRLRSSITFSRMAKSMPGYNWGGLASEASTGSPNPENNQLRLRYGMVVAVFATLLTLGSMPPSSNAQH